MLTPRDFNLPDRFVKFRQDQLEAAAKITCSSKYAFMLEAATGVGKSLIGATVQRLLSKKVVYTCSTKQLEDQILHDFPYARTLKGRSNYICEKFPRMFPKVSADLCTHTPESSCEFESSCPYRVAKKAALASEFAVLNTAYLLSEANYVGGFTGLDFLIADELDSTEDQLMSFIELSITQRQLERLVISTPKYKTKFESWVEWAQKTVHDLEPQLRKLQAEDREWMDWNTLRFMKSLQSLIGKLKFFVKEVDETWVWYPGEDTWVFKPVWVSKYAQGALWKHTSKVLGMSATILDPEQIARNLGLRMEQIAYLKLPSPFPKENRPTFYRPCANITSKTMADTLPKLAEGVKKIIDGYPDKRILVHTVSYKIRDYLMNNLPKKRLITHTTLDRAQILDKFKKSKNPLVLLSPSMGRGVDLRDDECRVVVIAKIPYPDLSDPQISRRLYASSDGQRWYAHRTISSIIQASGRAVRSAEDYADTFILDSQFEKLYYQYRDLFPRWWTEALKT